MSIGDLVRWRPTPGSPIDALTILGEVVGDRMLRVLSVDGELPSVSWRGLVVPRPGPLPGSILDWTFAPGRMELVAPDRTHDPGDEDRSER